MHCVLYVLDFFISNRATDYFPAFDKGLLNPTVMFAHIDGCYRPIKDTVKM